MDSELCDELDTLMENLMSLYRVVEAIRNENDEESEGGARKLLRTIAPTLLVGNSEDNICYYCRTTIFPGFTRTYSSTEVCNDCYTDLVHEAAPDYPG